MASLEKKILEIVSQHSEGIKAKEIAKILDVDKHEVNSILYSKLRNKCNIDSQYKWYLSERAEKKRSEEKAKKVENSDPKLLALCHYYLDCLNLENVNGISVYQQQKYAPNYVEIDSIDNASNNEDVSQMLKKITQSRKSLTSYIGYPVMVETFYSPKTGNHFRKLAPVFLFPVNSDGGVLERSKFPTINSEIINNYANDGPEQKAKELSKLATELGINNVDSDLDLEDIVMRLQAIRAWEWKEPLDPSKISEHSIAISNLEEDGIYNRAIFLAVERSPYTVGLEAELNSLSLIDKESYKKTVLYAWLHPEYVTHNAITEDNSNVLLNVLPMNTEQENAIQMAAHNNITVVTGPPGTGKSQVVTDFIINAAYNGKNVLFASKNNKAVDVVFKRVNALAKRPVMIRIGNYQYAHELAEITSDMLNAKSSPTDYADYESYLANFKSISEDYQALKNKEENIILLRNKVDHYNQEIEKYRSQYGSLIDHLSSKQLSQFQESRKKFDSVMNETKRENQTIWKRLFWSAHKNEAEKKRESARLEINKELDSLGQPDIEKETNTVTVDRYLNQTGEALNNILKYNDALHQLVNSAPLDLLEKEMFQKSQEMSDIAQDLWKAFLVSKPAFFTAEDRSEMSEFVSTMKLVNTDADLNDYPDIKKEYLKIIKKMTKILSCWAVTSLSAKGRIPFQPGIFDYVVIDEASQCDIASALPLLYRAKSAVIIGDPKQLSHISSITKREDMSLLEKYKLNPGNSYSQQSLYDYAAGIVSPEQIIQLRDHHRCYPDIIEYSNEEFYDDSLRVATDCSPGKMKVPSGMNPGIRWIQADGRAIRPSSGSAYNTKEIKLIIEELHRLVNDKYTGSIGVVTPFKAQADRIRDEVAKTDFYNYLLSNNDFLVNTVHRFQGDERDIMIFSTVISEGIADSSIKFLQNTGNLFNVAVTRAKSVLIVVGNQQYCSQCNVQYMEDFVRYYDNLNSKNFSAEKSFDNNKILGREYPSTDNMDVVSDWEKILYTALYDAGIHTIPQYPADKYRLDLALIDGERKLDIEVDGERYHKDWNGELLYKDQLRNHRLYEMGWDVRRFWVYQIRDEMPKCINTIQDWLDSKPYELNPNDMAIDIVKNNDDVRRMTVAGTFYNLTGKEKKELYSRIRYRLGKDDELIYSAILTPEPQNKYDKNAIRVEIIENGKKYFIGYIPKVKTSEVKEAIKNGSKFNVIPIMNKNEEVSFEILF